MIKRKTSTATKELLRLETETMDGEWLRAMSSETYTVGQGLHLCRASVQNGIRCPPSLVNIYKALKTDIPSFKIPDHGYLENWAKEGVLLLTVRAHNVASHSGKGREKFTDAIIQYLNERKMA
ncbi:5270_t:CDS:2 [Ambispora gerdemannii]|uniref:5270_t:CDS:1 n=1 Tax=Ambispora gerdemannii TaxID=144530 RepID=A0A9N8YQZ5_9GLOM|nr:5270_t:CDS:2 [Ambispora gerdemannii]